MSTMLGGGGCRDRGRENVNCTKESSLLCEKARLDFAVEQGQFYVTILAKYKKNFEIYVQKR